MLFAYVALLGTLGTFFLTASSPAEEVSPTAAASLLGRTMDREHPPRFEKIEAPISCQEADGRIIGKQEADFPLCLQKAHLGMAKLEFPGAAARRSAGAGNHTER